MDTYEKNVMYFIYKESLLTTQIWQKIQGILEIFR